MATLESPTTLVAEQPTTPAPGPAPEPDRGYARVKEHARRRRWPIILGCVQVVTGMAYSLWWGPLVGLYGGRYWLTPGDLWLDYRSAHYIGWGALGTIYSAGAGLLTFPGYILLLSPVTMLTGAFHMSETYPFLLPHPTAWLVAGPYVLALSSFSLFALDRLAERLGVPGRRRIALCVAEAALQWPVAAVWGHPDDLIAVGLACYAFVAVMDRKWSAAGWLFGAAVAFQPLVLLVLPLLLAKGDRSSLVGMVVRSALPSALLLAVPLSYDFHDTYRIVQQPWYGRLEFPTPWTSLAPRAANGEVLSGPSHFLAVVAGAGVGVAAWRKRWSFPVVLWAMTIVLALRPAIEPAIAPYYLWPAFALSLVLIALRSTRFGTVAPVVVGAFLLVQFQLGPWWVWYSAAMVFLVAAIAAGAGWPRRWRQPSASDLEPALARGS
jgi:hypothetical protein